MEYHGGEVALEALLRMLTEAVGGVPFSDDGPRILSSALEAHRAELLVPLKRDVRCVNAAG